MDSVAYGLLAADIVSAVADGSLQRKRGTQHCRLGTPWPHLEDAFDIRVDACKPLRGVGQLALDLLATNEEGL